MLVYVPDCAVLQHKAATLNFRFRIAVYTVHPCQVGCLKNVPNYKKLLNLLHNDYAGTICR